MPGSGKSTVGALLADLLNLMLVDTDNLIELETGQTLQQIVDYRGNQVFREIEERVLTEMPLFPSVISTGGSAVYSNKIMGRLSAASTVIYLKARFDTIEHRISLAPYRGIAASIEQTLRDIYEERIGLYESYGEIVVDCDNDSPEVIAKTIETQLSRGTIGIQ